jgi:hypothetical protein
MTELTSLMALVKELREGLARLEAEIAHLQTERGPAPPGDRSAIATPIRPPDLHLPNVILPTQTDDPDWITGGRPARYRDFQDCCAVGNDCGYFCSGTLIAPNVVVSAGHCFHPSCLEPDRVFLRGNDIHRPAQGDVVRVTATRHPDPEVDLKLLVLDEPYAKVKPRRIARESDILRAKEALLVGFGHIDLGGTFGYGIKRQVRVPIVSCDCTGTTHGDQYGCRPGFEMVAGQRGLARDTCKGDSGGPLYIQGSDGAYYLLGVTSRGAKGADHVCGDGGIYVRVDKFTEWIREVSGADI